MWQEEVQDRYTSYVWRAQRNGCCGTFKWVLIFVNPAKAHMMTQHKRFSPVGTMNLRQINRAVTVQKMGRGRRRAALVRK